MASSPPLPDTVAEPKLLCGATFSAQLFAADWSHCSLVSNYLSRVVSFTEADPFAFWNLLSTIINEILEAIFWHHAARGQIQLRLVEEGEDTLIVFHIPVDEQSREFYQRTLAAMEGNDVARLYRDEILREGPVSPAIGFFEIAANYGARFDLADDLDAQELRLAVRVNLSKLLEVQQR